MYFSIFRATPVRWRSPVCIALDTSFMSRSVDRTRTHFVGCIEEDGFARRKAQRLASSFPY